MVVMRVYEQPMLRQRTDFFCNKCRHWSAFFEEMPRNCATCNTKLPNFKGILHKTEERRIYHFGTKP